LSVSAGTDERKGTRTTGDGAGIAETAHTSSLSRAPSTIGTTLGAAGARSGKMSAPDTRSTYYEHKKKGDTVRKLRALTEGRGPVNSSNQFSQQRGHKYARFLPRWNMRRSEAPKAARAT
jgi:hypothetical protein